MAFERGIWGLVDKVGTSTHTFDVESLKISQLNVLFIEGVITRHHKSSLFFISFNAAETPETLSEYTRARKLPA